MPKFMVSGTASGNWFREIEAKDADDAKVIAEEFLDIDLDVDEVNDWTIDDVKPA